MLGHRTFCTLAAGALATPRSAWGQAMTSPTFFYVSLGPALRLYRIDADAATLSPQGTVTVPEKIQYAWPHPSAPFLYVASSNGGSALAGVNGDAHYLSALRIDKASGELEAHGASVALRARPIHVTVDRTGAFALTAYNNPSSVSVHRIKADGAIGEEVAQTASLDCGIFAHQIRVTPGNDAAILVCRGNDKAKDKPGGSRLSQIFRLQGRSARKPRLGRPGWRLWLRPAPSRFPSHAAIRLRVARAREQAECVPDFERGSRSTGDLRKGHAGRSQQHPLAPGRVYPSRASERPLRLSRQSRLRHRQDRWQGCLSRRREQHRRVCHRPGPASRR